MGMPLMSVSGMLVLESENVVDKANCGGLRFMAAPGLMMNL